jgi:hypothetical protein
MMIESKASKCLSIAASMVAVLITAALISHVFLVHAQALEGGLVSYWKFDEKGGVTALDFSGNGNAGSLVNNPHWEGGKFNTAIGFDGEDEFMQVHGLSSYADFTIAGWIKLNEQASTEPNGNNLFFQKDSTKNRILIRPAGYYIEFNEKYAQGATESNVNEWVYFAVVKDGSMATYYRNAIPVKSWEVGFSSVDFSSGVIGGQGNYWFNGLMDEVRLYDRALSTNELTELYNQTQSDDTLPPSVPSNAQASALTPYRIQLTWDPSTDNVLVAGYKIYRDGVHIDSAPTAAYTDVELDPSTTYTYRISALDGAGNESGLGTTIVGTTKAVAIRDHPRMYLSDEKIAFLKDRITNEVEPYRTYWHKVKYIADQYAEEAPYPPDDPKVTSPFGSREIGDRLPYFAMAYLLSGDVKYLESARSWMDAIVTYPTWGGDDDLVASHILFGMSVAYDWLYDELSQAERASYAAKMEYHADILYDLLVNVEIWWADNYHQNHNYVNTTAIMAAGVALYETASHPDDYLNAAYDNFTLVLQALPPDGAYTEGVGYWSYGINALLRYFDLEREILGVDRVLGNSWFQNTASYRLYASVPGYAEAIQIADVYDHRSDWYSPAQLQWLASKFNDPYSQWLASSILDGRPYPPIDWRNLVYYDEAVSESAPDNLPTYGYFEDLGIFTSRSSWEDEMATFLVFKAGPPMGHRAHEELHLTDGSRHAHTDAGVFLLDAYGEYMIVDNGYQYGWWTADHNTLTFDGGVGQLGETENPNGLDIQEILANGGNVDILHTDFTEDYEYLVADLTKIYKPELQLTRLIRHIIFIKKAIIVVIDEVESDVVHDIEWRLHINETASVDLDGRKMIATFPSSGAGFMLEDISSEEYARTIEDYSVSYTHEGAGITTTFTSKLFQILPIGNRARIETVIRPFLSDPPEDVVVLDRSNGNLKIQIEDLVVNISTADRKVTLQEAFQAGDVNLDGVVDSLDVHACAEHILGLRDWGVAADVNGDGNVDVLDLQEIVVIISGG